jgi:hypothetical protein
LKNRSGCLPNEDDLAVGLQREPFAGECSFERQPAFRAEGRVEFASSAVADQVRVIDLGAAEIVRDLAAHDDRPVRLKNDVSSLVGAVVEIGEDEAVVAEVGIQRTVGRVAGDHEVAPVDVIVRRRVSRDDDLAVRLNGHGACLSDHALRYLAGVAEGVVEGAVGEIADEGEGGGRPGSRSHTRNVRVADDHDLAVGLDGDAERFLLLSGDDLGGDLAPVAEARIENAVRVEAGQNEGTERPSDHDDLSVALKRHRGAVTAEGDRRLSLDAEGRVEAAGHAAAGARAARCSRTTPVAGGAAVAGDAAIAGDAAGAGDAALAGGAAGARGRFAGAAVSGITCGRAAVAAARVVALSRDMSRDIVRAAGTGSEGKEQDRAY